MVTLHDVKKHLERRSRDWKNAKLESEFFHDSGCFLLSLTVDPGFPQDFRVLYVSERPDGVLLASVNEENGMFLHDLVEVHDLEIFDFLISRLLRGASGVSEEVACDRFIRFPKTKSPNMTDVRMVLEDFLGGLGRVTQDADRLFVDLGMPKSSPFHRILPDVERFKNAEKLPRCFEVVKTGSTWDVLTRQQDDLTNSLASGFAEVVARYWRGELEEG